MLKAGLLTSLIITVALRAVCQEVYANNAFVSGELWADDEGNHINAHGGGILFYEGVYYWYGEHKGNSNDAQVGINCYSSKDLYHWHKEGVALAVSEDIDSEITSGCIMERPKVIYNDSSDLFVMWFHLELKGKGYDAARTAVATSKSVTGPFEYLRSYRPNAGVRPKNLMIKELKNKKTFETNQWGTPEWTKEVKQGMFVKRDLEMGQMSRDMTLFVDDDGTAYHIHASEENLTLHISRLRGDYLGFSDEWVTLMLGGHNEAPALFKYKNIYYLITSGCTGWEPNAARSFKAESILGPWEELGNPCRGRDAELTFHSQSTFVLPIEGKKDAFIFMADRWKPRKPIDGRYVWLPINMEAGKLTIEWYDQWNLSVFSSKEKVVH